MDLLAQAAHGLGVLGDRQAVPALAHLLANPNVPLVARREAAFALGQLDGDEAEGALAQALSDPCQSIADAAWDAYRGLKSRQSL